MSTQKEQASGSDNTVSESGTPKDVLEFALKAARIGDWDLDLLHDTSRRSLRHDQCFGYDRPIPETDWGAKAFLQHVHPDDREAVRSSLRDAIVGVTDWQSEFRVIWPDGSEHWLRASGTPCSIQEGRATRMLGIVVDISDHKRMEQALQMSEHNSRRQVEILKSSLDALAREPDPARLAGDILSSITQQFGAHSSSVWSRDHAIGTVTLEFAFEEGRVIPRDDARFAGVDLRLPMEDHWPWPEVFRTGKASVIEAIDAVPAFPLRDRLLPLGIVTVLLVPMAIMGQLEGAVGLRFKDKRAFSSEEIELAAALASQLMLAIHLTRLLQDSRKSAVIAERNRMARDIHDTLAQGFTGVIVQLEAAEDAKQRGLDNETAQHVRRAIDLARDSLKEARRSVSALRPAIMERATLPDALSQLFRKMVEGTSLQMEFTIAGEPIALPSEWEDDLLRIGQEVMTNVLRHADAKRFSAVLQYSSRRVHLELRDDGKGFSTAARCDGFGLLGIRERTQSMGATLNVESIPGDGTAILIVLALT